MKSTQTIKRFLTLAIAGLLLLLHGSGSQLVRHVGQATAKVDAQTKKSKGKADDTQSVIVKAATDEAVVAPATSFDFSQVTYLLPAPQFRFLLLNQPLLRRVHEVPYFYFSYLRYVFGHFIAPNAP